MHQDCCDTQLEPMAIPILRDLLPKWVALLAEESGILQPVFTQKSTLRDPETVELLDRVLGAAFLFTQPKWTSAWLINRESKNAMLVLHIMVKIWCRSTGHSLYHHSHGILRLLSFSLRSKAASDKIVQTLSREDPELIYSALMASFRIVHERIGSVNELLELFSFLMFFDDVFRFIPRPHHLINEPKWHFSYWLAKTLRAFASRHLLARSSHFEFDEMYVTFLLKMCIFVENIIGYGHRCLPGALEGNLVNALVAIEAICASPVAEEACRNPRLAGMRAEVRGWLKKFMAGIQSYMAWPSMRKPVVRQIRAVEREGIEQAGFDPEVLDAWHHLKRAVNAMNTLDKNRMSYLSVCKNDAVRTKFVQHRHRSCIDSALYRRRSRKSRR